MLAETVTWPGGSRKHLLKAGTHIADEEVRVSVPARPEFVHVLRVVVGVVATAACSQLPSDLAKLGGWTTLIDGEAGLENWNRVGDANWRPEDGAIVAYRGKGGFLVSKNSYKDFQLRAEFWADPATNSGVFFRVSNPKRIAAGTSYEVNISDQSSDPAYGTGAIVNVAVAWADLG